MITAAKIRAILQKAKVVQLVQSFEEARTTVTPTSKSDVLRQRIEERIAGITPTTAPTVAFVASSGFIPPSVALDGFWRRFQVSVANFGQGEIGRGSTKSPYDLDITIEVGYPAQQSVAVGSSLYSVDTLKSEDDEAIDEVMRGSDLLTNPYTIGDAQIVSLGGAYDIGNTIRRHRYVCHVKRTW